jgi:hypothetical protein
MSHKGNLLNPDGPHLSVANFRRWEAIIEQFLATYPEPFTFEPTSIAVSTATVALRNAVNTILAKPDISTSIDRYLLSEIWKKVSVCPRGNKIVIGSRDAQKTAAIEIARNHDLSSGPRQLVLHNPSERALLGLAILLLEKHIIDPVHITGEIPPFSPPLGVVFEPMGDGTFTML